jgi:hypothetical protein
MAACHVCRSPGVSPCYLLFFGTIFLRLLLPDRKSDYRIVFQQLDGAAPVIEKQEITGDNRSNNRSLLDRNRRLRPTLRGHEKKRDKSA